MKEKIKYFFLLFILVQVTNVFAQQDSISVVAEDEQLTSVLESISNRYDTKFAYDSDSFGQIRVSLKVENATVEELLKVLNSEYFIQSRFIDGTWVLVERAPETSESLRQERPFPATAVVSGFVKDNATGAGLIYCNVVAGESKGGITNELGFFTIEIPATDSARIRISHLGYQSLDTIVVTNRTVDLFLNSTDVLMDAIIVKRYEKQVLQSSSQSGKIAFNPSKSDNVPRVANDDLSNALLLIPGVDFLQGNSSGLSIRGGSATDNLILFDGIPVLETSHLLGNMSVLNSKFVQQVFVSRGGFDAEFGGRVAGLIQVTGKSGKNNNPYFEVGANLLNTNVFASLPLGEKFSVTTAWRHSIIDSWENYLYQRLVDGNTAEFANENTVVSGISPSIRYDDVNTKLSFHPSDDIEMNLNLLYGRDNQSKDYALIQTDSYFRNENAESENLGFSFNWNWQANRTWFHSFTAGYSTLEKSTIDETGELKEFTEVTENPGQGKGQGKGLLKTKEKTYEKFVQDIDNGFNEIEEYRASWKSNHQKGIFKSLAGVGWTANHFDYNFYANRTEAFVPVDSIMRSQSLYMLNGFLQQTISTGQFKFKWGLRGNTNLTSGKTYWQPRGGIEFYPVEGLQFHFLSGVYNQFLSGVKRIDSEGQHSRLWYLSDEKGVGVVRSYHYILGAEYDKSGWFANIEFYMKNTEGKTTVFAETLNTGDDWIISYFPYETAEQNKGIDFFLQKKYFVFNHMIAYSVSKTDEQIPDILGSKWLPAYNDRRHRLKLSELISWKNWDITASWQYATGLPVVKLNDADIMQLRERTSAFSQLDLAIAKKTGFRYFTIDAGVSLLNLLDRQNVVEVNYLRFASDQHALSVRSDVSALSFTPVFFVNFKFQ